MLADSEGGLITYMRTDGVSIAPETVQKIRRLVRKEYGRDTLSSKTRVYASNVLNAQEAHEAIQPTNVSMRPENLPAAITRDEKKLYQLIWQRTIASQMTDAKQNQVLNHSLHCLKQFVEDCGRGRRRE